ncbi:MarR family transcriptional regulator [Halarchaeum sp. CBA1220]|uniref:helix-turn-helix domain-containing protein n=1 Tax=Halarchaeum sp. CBA1220 TaxID=1853682 RepID=UPI000F3A801E|nr:helix-turn-helix domain-containing protein [Halarchaeum sp. CBA1220]QLC34512.1 MarR family transcriptional regulator [Halarchaeum sp. CBA1220]
MADSMSEMLRADMECEGLLECFHDLKALDRDIFEVLCEREESLTVDEIAEAVSRERSTAYRSVQRLLEAGFIRKEQVNYEQGGYYHVYEPRDGEEIARELQRTLNDWYAKMGTLIGEFERKYAEGPARTPSED